MRNASANSVYITAMTTQMTEAANRDIFSGNFGTIISYKAYISISNNYVLMTVFKIKCTVN